MKQYFSARTRVMGWILLLVFFSHCRKIELPEPQEGEPVLILDALLDSESLYIAAGDSSYLMRSSYRQDTAEVFVYQGRFEQPGCSGDCGPVVQFNIRGIRKGQALPDSVLRAGSFSFFQPLPGEGRTVYSVAFSGEGASTIGEPATTYLWDLGDGNSSREQSFVHEYADDSPRRVRLETRGPNGCFSALEKEIYFDTTALPCQVDFTIREAAGNTVEAVFDGPFVNFTDWYWAVADSSVTEYPLGPMAAGDSIPACLTASLQGGCTVQNCKTAFRTADAEGRLGYCSTTFSYQPSVDTLFVPAPQQWGTAWIDYTDENNQQYSSAYGPQPAGTSFFEVLSAEPFFENENGQLTRKLEVAFSCRLYHTNGQFWRSFSGTSTLAVAHP